MAFLRMSPPRSRPKRVRAISALLLALVALAGWTVLPSLHLGACNGPHAGSQCCHDDHDGHDAGEDGPGSHGAPSDHDATTCAICVLASLSTSGPLALPAPLPQPFLRPERPAAAREVAPRPAPSLTDAPTRGPPTPSVG